MIEIDYKQEQVNYYNRIIASIDAQIKELKRKKRKHQKRLKRFLI